jgi:hypothetical protein
MEYLVACLDLFRNVVYDNLGKIATIYDSSLFAGLKSHD